MTTMNDRAWRVADALEANADGLRVGVGKVGGARVIDCGGAVTGSLGAGLHLARACLADLADVSLVPSHVPDLPGPAVQVVTDDPVRACLASQYAGWQIKVENFFAMGSGPMRAVYAKEEMFQTSAWKEEATCAVGALETRHHPTEDVVASLVAKLPTTVERITLLVAPAASIAGTLQVVARSVETALHKLHELKFDLSQIVSAHGLAPLPPVSPNELEAIGRANDAILYGGRVALWVRADDEVLAAVGPKVPSAASKDYGAPFAEVFARYGDFYKIDPLLFSPAEVTFFNLKTGKTHSFGYVESALVKKSFLGA